MAEPSVLTTAAPTSLPEAREQRTALRHRCSLAALTRLYHPATGQRYFAWVHDVSGSGVAFDLRVPLEPGQELVCLLKGNRPGECYQVSAEVLHARPVEGLYRVGCRFAAPLPQEQLEAVLQRLRGG